VVPVRLGPDFYPPPNPPGDLSRPELDAAQDERRRKAILDMAIHYDLDPESYQTLGDLWEAITVRISEGIASPDENIIGNPFAVFVCGRCWGHDDRPHKEWEQIAVVKTGRRVSQYEFDDIVEKVKRDQHLKRCQQCGRKISTWSNEINRILDYESALGTRPGKP
jgi:hypothetical protein